MTEISAGQQIYGNVESDRSPTNTGGFQTLYYSKSAISPAESEEIERRMGYYFSAENPEKKLFFRIGNKFITTRILPLSDVDKFGRKGLFIAHSFVFLDEDIRKIGYNPFVLFNLFEELFVRTTYDALSNDRNTGQDIPPITIVLDPAKIRDLDTPVVDIIKPWKPEVIKDLISLVISEGDVPGELPNQLVITGNQPAILDTLQMVFSLIPDDIRSLCTFDTYFFGCNPVTIKNRIYCYPLQSAIPPQFIQIDAEKRTVLNVSSSTESPYLEWIFHCCSSGKSEEVFLFRNTAIEIERYLSDKNCDKEKILLEIRSPALETFLDLNPRSFNSKVSRYMNEIVSNTLAKYVINAVTKEYTQKPNAILLEKILRGFHTTEIARYLFYELKEINTPSPSEVEDLRNFLTKTDDALLRVIYLKWINDFVNISTILKSLNEEDFKIAISILVNVYKHPQKNIALPGIDTRSPYMNWLISERSSLKMEEVWSFRNTAFELDQFLLGRKYNREILVADLKSPILGRFITINQNYLRARVPEYFSGVLSPNLVKYIIKPVNDNYSTKPDIAILEKLLVGFDGREIEDYLYNELKGVKSPNRQEIKAVGEFLTSNSRPFLHLLYNKWTNNSKPVPVLLKQLTDDEYQVALTYLLGAIDFESLFVEPKIGILVNAFILKSKDNRNLLSSTAALIQMIISSNQEILLQKMIPYLPLLKCTEILSVQESINRISPEKRQKIPREFSRKMDEIVEKYSERSGILNLKPVDDILTYFKRK
jgi:hypothetical protein